MLNMTINDMVSANINLETGVAFGYISSNVLDSDVVDELMHGPKATDLSWADAVIGLARKYGWRGKDSYKAAIFLETHGHPEELEEIQVDEPLVEGVYEGVHYASSWLGGALNFFIFFSPHVTDKANRASPCLPNAGILDTLDGEVQAYDVPAHWRAE
jgi:hypothetical protein